MPNVFEREEQQAMDELEHVIEEIAAELVGDVEGVASSICTKKQIEKETEIIE